MEISRLDWNLIRSFLAVFDAGTLSGAAAQTGISQPTLGRHIDELEAATDLVLFARGRNGMTPTVNALALLEEAKTMRAGADAFALAAAGREQKVEGTIRITASEIMSTYVLPDILSRLADTEPGLEIELVASNSVQNLLARDADIAVRMVRPMQNDLIARKVNDFTMGTYGHVSYLDKHGRPQTIEDLFRHRILGYDRDQLILNGMAQMGLTPDRGAFRFRTDHQVAYWELVKAGAGIGFGPVYVASKSPGVERVLPALQIPGIPVWLASHRELNHSVRVRFVYDFLAEALQALPLAPRDQGAS